MRHPSELRFQPAVARRVFNEAVLILGLLALLGCKAAVPQPAATGIEPEPPPKDFAAIARGKELYAEHCAACHGEQAEGHPEWRKLGPKGELNAPPLNGTGHDWHHSKALLHRQIREGGEPPISTMPGFEDTLSDRQIDDIIAWFQSLWPEEVYQAWYEMDQRHRATTTER